MTKKLSFLLAVIRNNAVTLIAFLAALVTAFIVPPDSEYLGYFDFKTLSCLFSVLAVVCALRGIRFFYTIARKIVRCFKNARASVLALVYITFIGSLLIANDMALLTFLPLGYLVLHTTKKEHYMAFTFIMQNIAANLGGMLTPFGNPQNLYLYSKFGIGDGEFIKIMALPFALSVLLITLCCLVFVKPEPLEVSDEGYNMPKGRMCLYLALFALSIAIVFGGVSYILGLALIFVTLLIVDRRALLNVDYGLLLTFVFFFVFSGNLARIEPVRSFFASLLEYSTLTVSAISCQFISNVPTAILLSSFTDNYKELLMGVNIGGVGTLISSLASLITFREYSQINPKGVKKYIVQFSLFNFAFLFILLGFCLIIVNFI